MSMVVAAEVAAALERRGAVVALESTIICHGPLLPLLLHHSDPPPLSPAASVLEVCPNPKNLQTATEVEAIVRVSGTRELIPATIAILDGVPHAGLNSEQLKRLATSGRQFQKTA